MKGQSARQWADTMFLHDTPGGEITLYMLSKMFQWHSIVFTSAKCWSTLEVGVPTSEDDLFDSCDIWLLYIEPGVFGELQKKPRMPPAPFQNSIFESATAIIPPIPSITLEIKPLNLCIKSPEQVTTTAEDDTVIQANASENKLNPYVDAILSGGLERIHCDSVLDQLLDNMLLNEHIPAETGDNTDVNEVLEFPDFSNQELDITTNGQMISAWYTLTN